MGWRDTIQDDDNPKKASSWRDTIRDDSSPPLPSQLESTLRGAAQGASLGFEDELAGAGGVLGNALGSMGVDKVQSPHPDIQEKLDAIANANTPSTGDVYRKGRDDERALNAAAEKANPKSYLGGGLVGGLGSSVAGGIGGLKGALATGATMGFGGSNSDITQGDLETAAKNAAIDTGLGAAGGAAGYGVGKAIPKVWNGIKYFGKKALTNLGPSGEAIAERFAGKAQDTAKSYPELAEDMRDTINELSTKRNGLANEAKATLSTEADIPKETVTSAIDDALAKVGVQGKVIGPNDKRIVDTLSSLKNDLGDLDKNISEQDLKKIIQTMDDNINWDDSSYRSLNTVLQGLRTQFDSSLKFRNGDYKKAMEPVAAQTGLIEDLKRLFNLKGSAGEGLQPSDTTATKIQSSLRDNKAVTQDKLEQLADITGKDYPAMANDYQLSQQFQKTGAQGSKRTNIGAALGAGIGGLSGGLVGAGAGTALGSLAGGAMDAYGGQVAGKIIDGLVKVGNWAPLGKFAPVVQKAAAQGPQALAVLGAILGSNPEFKKQMGIQK